MTSPAMTLSARCTRLLAATAIVSFVAAAPVASAQADSMLDPLGIQGIVAHAPTKPLYGYHHHHRFIRESLDKRKARYALARACASSIVSADICKFTAGIIAMTP